jgi:hypothetical protein
MLTQDQLAFVREYFVDVSPTAAGVRIGREGVAASSFAAECMDHPAVKSVIGAVWRQIMGDIAVNGRAIHHPLPEQGREQSFILIEMGAA